MPSGSTLNLAVPVAAVLTDGDRDLPDRLAMKADCCANAGIYIDINDRTNVLMVMIEVYLPIGNLIDCFIFMIIRFYNGAKSIRYLLNFVKLS